MPPRTAISNGIITLVIVFFMLMLGMLLKARYRLGSEEKTSDTVETAIPKAIPIAVPTEEIVQEARAYKEGDWWVLPHPQLIVSRANEPDTFRMLSGQKEDVFVLYFVDAAETTWSKPLQIREQAEFFQKISQQKVIDTGNRALAWVTDQLLKNEFTVYTKWTKVPNTERYYAMIQVKNEAGKFQDLGEMLVRKGFASGMGMQTGALPDGLPPLDKYTKSLARALTLAKMERQGAWAEMP